MQARLRGIRVATASAVVAGSLAAIAVAGIREKDFEVGPGATEGGAVACRDGETPTGGGFKLDQRLDPPERLAVHSTYPSGKRWKVEAYNFEGTTQGGSAIAVCSKADDLFVRTKSADTGGVEEEAQVTARCPDGSKALGGGGKGPGDNTFLRGSFPAGDSRSWGARFSNSPAGKIQAFVVCDRSPHGLEIVVGSATSDPPRRRGGFATVTAKAECSQGALPVGGGHTSASSTSYRQSRPVKGAWRVTADAFEGVMVSAYAVCQK